MKSHAFKVAASTFVLLFIASACRCDGGGGGTGGATGVISPGDDVDGDGPIGQIGNEFVYDFGSVFMGQSRTLQIRVANTGRGNLVVASFEKAEGDAPVKIGPNGDQQPTFSLAFDAPTSIAAAGVVQFDATFSPPETADITKPYEVKLLLRAENTGSGPNTAILTLRGTAESGVCEIPAPVTRDPLTNALVLDFGSVAKGDSYQQNITLRNPATLPAKALVGDVEGTDATVFTFAPESMRGEVTIEPGTTRDVALVFKPTETKSYYARVRMRASDQCPVKYVDLVGHGVDSILTWAPPVVDCGYVTPGVTVTREVTFTNHGNADANLTALTSTLPNEFWLQPQGTTSLAVAGKGGTAKVTVACKPGVLGPRQALLKFNTNLPTQPAGQVQLKVYGGGPDIDTLPQSTLNFGKVGYFAGANVFQTRKLTVLNKGTKPQGADSSANLKLGKVDGSGNYVAPYFNLQVTGSTQPSEFEATLSPSYNSATGLEATGNNAVDLIVKVIPKSLGRKEATLTLFSNDPDEPELTVQLSADAQAFPDCQYQVTPTNLNFGLISPPDYRELEFTVKSLLPPGAGNCLISNLDLKSGSDKSFTLPGGVINSKELTPGEELKVKVRAWPQGTQPASLTAIMGAVEFFAASTAKPSSTVNLNATVGQSCLTIGPDTLNFGTVKKGCRSPDKTFSIYNTCAGAPVLLNGVSIQAAAGQPAGGPDCNGSAPCPEFVIVSNPVVGSPLSIAPGGAAVTFSARYQPIDYTQDTGAIALNVTQNGQNVTYVVTLEGKGDTVGQNVDTFTQDFKPKADILLVIDNSGSMSPIQSALAQNFASFIQYAVAAKVDYHISVITTDNPVFRGDSSNPKVLTPSVAEVQSKFSQKVVVGTTGSSLEKSFEPAVQALTAPLVTSENSGFLRNDASLAILAVSDEEEQSGNTVTYWYNQLLNIKGFNKANLFSFNAVAWFNAATCSTTRDNGRYAQMVQMTSGIREEICTQNWAKTLEQIGKRVGGFKTNFFLTGNPDLSRPPPAIVVQIDGQNVPQTDPVRNVTVWTYDPVGNSVNFDPNYVPEPGQSMTITYHVTCN